MFTKLFSFSARIEPIRDLLRYPEFKPGDTVEVGGRIYQIERIPTEDVYDGIMAPKSGTKIAVELETGRRVVLKFDLKMDEWEGDVLSRKTALKEQKILALVRGHSNFVQGETLEIPNMHFLVHIIDFVEGSTLERWVLGETETHSEYFEKRFPMIADAFIRAARALHWLHQQGEYHGDFASPSQHILWDPHVGELRWCDFNFELLGERVGIQEDIFNLLRIFLFIAGRGMHQPLSVRDHPENYPDATSIHFDLGDLERLTSDTRHADLFPIRNLRKLFPYIPEAIHRILMRCESPETHGFQSAADLADAIKAALG